MKNNLYDIIRERILVLDGGLGTMIQSACLTEDDYRGERFADWPSPLKGCNDLLMLTAPDVVRRIHEAYFSVGADIVATNSFNANAVSLADYGLQEYAYEINLAAARTARTVADEFTMRNPSKPRFIGGSVGPTNRTASMSADVSDPASREITFTDLVEAYTDQIRGLLDGGVDLILLETIFDTLNAKAGIYALEAECERRGVSIPVVISGTLADASGRTLSGQVVEAFYASIVHARPLAVGFNCAYGARQMKPYLERLAEICEYPVSAYPNAGLPNLMGGYDETPQMMAADVEEYMREGIINLIGGCCGTTPAHIAEFAAVASRYKPRAVPEPRHETVLSGLEPLRITRETNFVNVGERANVAGSAKFARLIREGNYEEAIGIARQQVESGAQIVDVCMDDGLIDGSEAMRHFLNLAMSEPEISRAPVMIDSSSWDVLVAGLQCVQGKSIVNSISLKEGEGEFLRRARTIRRYGAAAVVMLFDETGQADTFDRKVEVAERAYRLLTGDGFPAEDIVFDPNVLAIATGIEEHDRYGVDFIEACRWIKQNLPGAKVSGGVSNLSFAFRGNNKVREAMHSVFLYHAIAAGMDMGIVNPALLQVYTDIEPELLELAEDAVLARRPDATERLSAYAMKVKDEKSQSRSEVVDEWRSRPLEGRIEYAMTKGVTDHIEDDIMEAYRAAGSPMEVIDTMLMPPMDRIGVLFGEGKMFLPQVVKSARVMKKAVGVLTPYIEEGFAGSGKSAGKILIATVKGDVHDIGKNIVSVVMSCNGYEVIDLGVMVDSTVIADRAVETGADVVGLSGLISPSLEEMVKVIVELGKRGLDIPVIIGGATTSQLHTAVKIAPNYAGTVIHSRDASENIGILGKLFSDSRDVYIDEIKERQQQLRESYESRDTAGRIISLAEARENRYVKTTDEIILPKATARIVLKDKPIGEVRKFINWTYFLHAWEIRGLYPEIVESTHKGEQARKLIADAEAMLDELSAGNRLTLNGVVGIYPARSEGDDIIVDKNGSPFRLPQLRNQEAGRETNLSLADYVASPADDATDYVALFAITAGEGLKEIVEQYRMAGDDYNAIMCKLVADRLAEAFAESVHLFVRRELWGYDTGEPMEVKDILAGQYQGIRVAFGYPACPDHSLKKEVMEILDATVVTSMRLTENYMIDPGESICGMMMAGSYDGYFSVGKIAPDQLADYALRRGMSGEEIKRIIPQHLL